MGVTVGASPRDPDVSAIPARRPTLLAIFLGGCLGGWARYAVTTAWPAAAGRFPWSTFTVNTVGAFVLSIVVVVAVETAAPRLTRPLLGTGFCGALTTFSSVVVAADELVAHRHAATAAAYVVASIAAGLAAAAVGLVGARAVAERVRARP